MAATASRAPGCCAAASTGPPSSSPTSPTGDRPMIRRPLRAALLGAALRRACRSSSRSRPRTAQWIVFDPIELRAERPLRRARAAADQQPDRLAPERGADADQPGAQPREPALFLAAAAAAVLQRTQQLLAQAQRLAYEVSEIEHAFTQGYGSAASLGSSQQMFADARDALAELRRRLPGRADDARRPWSATRPAPAPRSRR